MHLSEVFQNLVLQQAAALAGSKPTGRPRTLSNEDALQGIFRVLRTGMQWRELDAIPGEVHYTTVFRRFRTWGSAHVFETAYTRALQTYRRLRRVQHYCVDSSYVKNRFGRRCVGRNHTDRGRKALKLSLLVDDLGVTHGVCSHPGNRPDVVLLEDTLRSALLPLESVPLYADRGYDSRRNRALCEEHGLRDRIFRRRTKTVRRTNARRIVVEHAFAWLDAFRRLLHCYEQGPEPFVAFVLLALGHRLGKRLEREERW